MKELVEALEGIRVVVVRTAEGKARLVLEKMGREEAQVFAGLKLQQLLPA
jgi:hypothetical protein